MTTIPTESAPVLAACIATLAIAAGHADAMAGTDLLFTEYVEGSSNNKALEIYNGTGASVDLNGYEVQMFFNGSASPGLIVELQGSVAAADVFVLAQASANAAILAQADQTNGSGWFNGDDAVALLHDGVTVDVIGQIGFDPGSEWGAGNTSTQNNTLRRLESVTAGDGNGADAFDPTVEWQGFQQDTFDGIGFYPDISDPGLELGIHEIQGAAQTSPFEGEQVITTGIVTAVDSVGFYIQDPVGDGDPATSDGLFVFTGAPAAVNVGDEVEVGGAITEFFPGGEQTGNLSITEITGPQFTVLDTGRPLPAPAVIGTAGREAPTEVIDDDQLTVYDPAQDGIDFYESVEGMRITVSGARTVSRTSRFDEIYVVSDDAGLATGLNARGGITIRETDFNPERVQLQFDADLLPGFDEQVNTGDFLGDVTGVASYSFGNTEILLTETFVPLPAGLAAEVTVLAGDHDTLTIASYNVLNLDPKVEDPGLVGDPEDDIDDDVGDGRFAAIAAQIVDALNAPDIVALQEIQDNDGAELTGVVDASLTLSTLSDAIVTHGGPIYAGFDLAPENLADGGQPGGNIRVAFLYRADRVSLVEGSAQRIADTDLDDGDAFENSRKPLAAQFVFNGQTLTLVNNHFSSKSGSTPLFGTVQPPVNGSVAQREAQAQEVNDFVDGLLATDPLARIVVLGDLNEFTFNSPLAILTGGATPVLTNLSESLPELERYTFVFDGNAQALDHALVSDALQDAVQYDIVHVNVEFTGSPSDHEPLLLSIDLPVADTDSDGVPDAADNCVLESNSDQRDTDADGIGNICDGDFNGDCTQNFLDLGEIKENFFAPGDLDTDLNGDGSTNFLDLGLLKEDFFLPPGPSGVPNVCDGTRRT